MAIFGNRSKSGNKKPAGSAQVKNTAGATVSGIYDSAEVSNISGATVAPYRRREPLIKRELSFRNPDYKSNLGLVLYMFIILLFGLIVLYSVSAPAGYIVSNYENSSYYVIQQLQFTVVGVVIVILLNFIPIDWFKNRLIMIVAYAVSLILIVATALVGKDYGQGARRWLGVGSFAFQPSEIFKIALVIFLAFYRLLVSRMIETGRLKPKNPKKTVLFNAFFEFILPVGLILFPASLVLMQPHFSCFLILGAVTVVCFLVSGINIRSWFVGTGILLLAAAILAGGLMIVPKSREYIIEKVTTNFAHVFKRFDIYTQDEDEELTDAQKDESLQVTRAKDAIGSGGLSGVGFGLSRSKYSYVSESHNDYIYSIYVEETGFIGGTFLILFYLIFLVMGLRVAYKAKDVFCRIIATGYTFLIVLEAMWNIGVELTVLPSTGITLPFFSYGGTAQVLLLIAYGMVLCVARSGVTYEKDGKKHA